MRTPGPPFVWGTATAAYQIEGAVDEDGRGPSIWDTFSHTPGRVADGATGDVACDHYHRWREDLDLMADLGVDAYRFSVAWPRIQPSGAGPAPARGLDFYRRLADGLRERAIAPFVTLYHWDLPQAIEDAGGWRERDTALRFADYAGIVAEALAEFEPRWITLNEPYCSAIVGYAEGRHAPGAREGHGALAAAHHLLLAHGLALPALRPQPVGVTLNLSPAVPASSSTEDMSAAKRQDLLVNRLFTEPLLAGRYPADAPDVWSGITDFSFVHDGDLAVIAAPLDFLGVNYYYRDHVRATAVPEGPDRPASAIGVVKVPPRDVATTGVGWPIEPEGLYGTLTGLTSQFAGLPPIYVTENGCAYLDEVVCRMTPGSRSSPTTWTPWPGPSPMASTCGATSTGHSSTISSEPVDTHRDSAWCTWTTTPRCVPPKPATGGCASSCVRARRRAARSGPTRRPRARSTTAGRLPPPTHSPRYARSRDTSPP